MQLQYSYFCLYPKLP